MKYRFVYRRPLEYMGYSEYPSEYHYIVQSRPSWWPFWSDVGIAFHDFAAVKEEVARLNGYE